MSDWLTRARAVIATGASTLSKRSRAFVEGSSPVAFSGAAGCLISDVGGHCFTDWSQGLGVNILGGTPESVTGAVCKALARGNLATLPSALEPAAAEALIAASPYAGTPARVRWLNSGSESCIAAVRIARRFTGKHWIVSSGYHGWAEAFMCLQAVTEGIPAQYRDMACAFPWGDIDGLCEAMEHVEHGHGESTVAAVILEPAIYDEPPARYMQAVADVAHKAGALLIFDETVTGFRYPKDKVTQGVVPDLTVYGKAIGAGVYPVAAVVGRADVMEKSDAISGTYCGSAGACAAVMAALGVFGREDVTGHIWKIGTALKEGVNALGYPLGVEGMPPRMKLTWRGELADGVSRVVEQLAYRGIHLNPGGILPSYAHTDEDVQRFVTACADACRVILAGEPLRGLPVQQAFVRDPGAQPKAAA